MPGNMFRQTMFVQRIFMLILYTRLFLGANAASDTCTLCNCKSYGKVNCKNRRLTSVPQNIPRNTTFLNLAGNSIKDIKDGSFSNLYNLKKIYLSYNQIEDIEDGSFVNLPNLKELYLNWNRIKDIKDGWFANLSNLKTLSLHHNQIKHIKDVWFTNLYNLKELILSSNRITDIEDGSFANLYNLRRLELFRNQIKEIRAGSFANLYNLRRLSVYENLITDIKDGSFANLYNLTYLYLNWNQIKDIKDGWFANLSNLKTLYLDHNQMTHIKAGSFANLSNLKVLTASSSRITDIEDGSFTNLSNLKDLYLNNNSIAVIKDGWFSNLCNLKTLILSSNRITDIEDGSFANLYNLRRLYLNNNSIAVIKDGSFANLYNLQTLSLHKNQITDIKAGSFANLYNLQRLYLRDNRIKNYEDGAFLFLPSITDIDLHGNKNMMCGCHLPALVKYMKNNYKQYVRINGRCQTDLGKRIPIWKFSQCRNYSLFQRNLQCQTCSGMMCNDSEVTNCPGAKPVCRLTLSMNGVTPKFERSCSTYRKCVEAMRKNAHRCNKWTDGTSCTGCCVGNLCNKNGFIGFCNGNTTSNNGIFHWPVTKIGSNATIPCHANVATRYCSSSQSMASLKCSPFVGVWQEPDMTQCYNTEWITRRLKDIRSEDIDQRNVENISKEVLNVSQKSVYFKQQDIDLAVDILEKMAPLISNVSANIALDNILLGINNIMNTPEKVLAEAEQADRSVSRMLDIIETMPEKIPLEEQQVTAIYSNLGIGVAKVNRDTFDGLFYGVSYGTNETEANTLLYNHSYPDPQQEDIQTFSFISLPKSLPKHLKVEEISALSRIVFFSMRNDKLYRVTQNSKGNTNINSYVLAANVPNIRIINLDEPVKISFDLIHQNAANPECVYWDESPGEDPRWSTKGCKISDYVPGKKVVCSCDHLASFALLMDVYANEDDIKNVKSLSVISNIGCGLSFVCLVLTVIIHVCFR